MGEESWWFKWFNWRILSDKYAMEGTLQCTCGDTVHFTNCYQLVKCPNCQREYHMQVGMKINNEKDE